MLQFHGDAPRTRPLAFWLLALLAIGSVAKADRISIRGGGQVKGKLIPDKAHPGQWLFLGEVGKTPMPFKKEQILLVTPEKGPLDEYVVRLAKDRPTAEAEYELGVWCDENNLPDLAQVHYDLTVKRDSTFEAAHRKLGHVLLDGRWLNGDELKEAQGLVKFKGRWLTPEEKERKEAQLASIQENNVWVRRLRQLREAYVGGNDKKSQEAERRLLAIDDSAAVGPVVKVLGDDPIPNIRSIAARILGLIPGQEASTALVGRLLAEEDESVRQATMAEVARRESSEVVPSLVKGLRSPYHQVVNRAAWGLGNLNASLAVPRLVAALITVEQEVVMVDEGGSGNGVGAPGSGFSSYSSRAIPILTPPAVGPGVVAFGATSIPSGPGPGSSIGGGGSFGSGSSRGPVARLVSIEHRNGEVLAALVKLTGRDYGFDVSTWKQWVTTSFKVATPPSRRVREP